MKIQNLAVIFIIIILPISLILTSYTQNQIKTINLQTSYDTKLNNATYDALKAFQLNTINSDTSDIAYSKLRDIEASVNTFFNSISSNFNMVGYNKDILKEYVPALVYTMYDGYYIYSPFFNDLKTLSDEEKDKSKSYTNGEKISDLKPYVHYSCRYKKGMDSDFTITYSLDNYITIQGIVKGKSVYKYGYLLDNVNVTGDSVTYRNVKIDSEKLEEYVNKDKYTYVKINGTKHYKDNNGTWFSYLNGEKNPDRTVEYKENNEAAKQYYKEALDFKIWIQQNIQELKVEDAVYEDGNETKDGKTLQQKLQWPNGQIFDFGENKNSIENPDSNFNQHRLDVIRYSIEKNLSIAIANYNKYPEGTEKANFQMPELKEDEWDKIIHNVSIISFMQGLNIGGKIYNGYSIITNTKNNELVSEDSIYIVYNNQYYKPTDKIFKNTNTEQLKGFLNVDFETRSSIDEFGDPLYFLPHKEYGSYSSIVNHTDVNDTENIYEYIDNCDNDNLKKAYFTALGRERYSMYKTNNPIVIDTDVELDGKANNSNSEYYIYNGIKKAYYKE